MSNGMKWENGRWLNNRKTPRNETDARDDRWTAPRWIWRKRNVSSKSRRDANGDERALGPSSVSWRVIFLGRPDSAVVGLRFRFSFHPVSAAFDLVFFLLCLNWFYLVAISSFWVCFSIKVWPNFTMKRKSFGAAKLILCEKDSHRTWISYKSFTCCLFFYFFRHSTSLYGAIFIAIVILVRRMTRVRCSTSQ